MTDIVKQWIVDAEAYEFQKMYKVSTDRTFAFNERQGDFYITLLNRMYNILQEVEDARYDTRLDELADIAHALLVYSDRFTESDFSGIDKISNQLYVASIYFLIGYEAIGSFILREYDLNSFSTNSAIIAFYIVSGSAYRVKDISDTEAKQQVDSVRDFLLNGNDNLEHLHEEIERKFDAFSFESLDDFFDTAILMHVLRKFQVHNLWNILYKYDSTTDWTEYIRFSKKQHILSLLPSQEDAVSKGLLTFAKSFSLKMPTSAGKSYITELLIYQELKKNPDAKVLYLAPLRSLSRELKERYVKVGRVLGFTTRAIYGGSTFTIDQSLLDEAQLLISTPETFTTLEETMDEQLRKFSLVICDEGQLLDSLKRGINYELLLTRLKKIENVRYLFLSAIIPNIEDVNTWLGGTKEEVGDSQYRPCPIKFAHLNGNFGLDIKDENYKSSKFVIADFLSPNERNGVSGSQRSKACAVALKALDAGPVLLFTATRSGNKGCLAIGADTSSLIAKGHLPFPRNYSRDSQNLDIISEYVSYQFGTAHQLSQYIKTGYAYHHGSLPQDIREIIEQAYSNKVIPLLICTNTLAEGVNLPIQTLVLYNLTRYDFQTQRQRTIDITDLKNIVGRAGRAGHQRFGVVVSIGDSSKEPYNNTIKALKNQGLHKIMGTLFDVVRVFYKQGDNLDDKAINRILEVNELASAIDTMISRSINVESLDDIDVDEIVKESLAYHVGNEDIRECLKRVFRARHKEISSKLNENNFKAYHNTGLSINDIEFVEKSVTTESLSAIDIKNPLSDSWLDYAIGIIRQMPSYKNGVIVRFDEEPPRELEDFEIKTLLTSWINGAQYWEIAESMECDVNNAIELVMFLQNSFHLNASSLIRYIQEIGFDTTSLGSWADMIKYGVNSIEKLMLIRSGLSDRIAVNALLDTPLTDYLQFDNAHVVRFSMKEMTAEVLAVSNHSGIPTLCKQRVETYLSSL